MTADTQPRETLLDRGPRPPTRAIARFVAETAALTQPDRIHWVTGSDEEWLRADRRPGRDRHVHPAQPGDQAELVPRRLRPHRRRARRGPDLHLLGGGEGLRAHQQLDGPARDEGPDARAVRRLHAGPHDVRHPVRDGPPRLRAPDVRHRAHRLGVRHRVDAGDGPHRHRRAPQDGGARRGRSSCPRCTPSGCRWSRARPTWPGRATTPSTSCSSPRSARSGPSVPATAATRCWARSATRCGSPR